VGSQHSAAGDAAALAAAVAPAPLAGGAKVDMGPAGPGFVQALLTDPCASSLLPTPRRPRATKPNRKKRQQYKVKDITQADFGRLEIELAEAEMPGLMSARDEFGAAQPFKVKTCGP